MTPEIIAIKVGSLVTSPKWGGLGIALEGRAMKRDLHYSDAGEEQFIQILWSTPPQGRAPETIHHAVSEWTIFQLRVIEEP